MNDTRYLFGGRAAALFIAIALAIAFGQSVWRGARRFAGLEY